MNKRSLTLNQNSMSNQVWLMVVI